MVPNELINSSHQIAFWGPSSSGKTWLFKSFIKKINLLDESLQSHGFNVIIEDDEGMQVTVANLSSEGTKDTIHQGYRFSRTCNENVMKDEFVRNVNTHYHDILIVDDQGSKFEDEQLDINIGRPEEVSFARKMVSQSEFIVIALEVDDHGEDRSHSELANELTEQLKVLAKLLINKPKRYIAACLTKVDMLGEIMMVDYYNQDDGRKTVESLLTKRFGDDGAKQITHTLESLKNQPAKHDVKLFSTSAIGYFVSSTTRKTIPNIKSTENGSSAIDNITKWAPLGVDRPFFWLFDKIEKARLSYIPEKRDFFQLMIGRENIIKARLDAYVPYSKLIEFSHQVV